MKKSFVLAIAAGLAAVGNIAAAQTVDGTLTDLGAAITSQTEPPSFGASMYVESIRVAEDTNNVYIGVEGDSSFNNAFILLIDVESNAAGDTPAPAPAPTGGGGALSGGDFVGCTLELSQIDFGFSGNSGDDNNGSNGGGNDASFYLDFVNYTDGPNTAVFVGTDAVNDGNTDTGNTTGAGITFAYSDNDGAGVGAGNIEGLEIVIPKATLGITANTNIRLFAALTGGSGYFSSSVLPPVTGQGANNIGTDPNFTTLAGTQIAGPVAIGFTSVSDWTLMDE